MYLIKNAKILTMADKNYESGDILIENGKIEKIDENISADCETFDAKGMWVLPGFIDAHCHVGMWEDKIGEEGADGNEATKPITPELRAIDAVNPEDPAFYEALIHGITSVCTGPGSANVIGGQFVAMKTWGRRVDEMIIKEPLAVKAALGENPKRVYSAQDTSPSTRMATAAEFRKAMIEAQDYKIKMESKDADDSKDHERDLAKEILVDVLDGKTYLKIHCHRADDICTAIRLCKEFNVKYTLEHCTDGYRIADILKEEGVKPILGPLLSTRSKIELKDLSFSAPKVLNDAGVKFAMMTDHPVIPLYALPICAAISVREGLDEMEALKSITINAAEIVGIEDRVGSLEVGKDADIAIYNGNPLEIKTKAVKVFVDGNVVYSA
ncbi:MAG: amidohydrolase [Eubacteriales bacterium]